MHTQLLMLPFDSDMLPYILGSDFHVRLIGQTAGVGTCASDHWLVRLRALDFCVRYSSVRSRVSDFSVKSRVSDFSVRPLACETTVSDFCVRPLESQVTGVRL